MKTIGNNAMKTNEQPKSETPQIHEQRKTQCLSKTEGKALDTKPAKKSDTETKSKPPEKKETKNTVKIQKVSENDRNKASKCAKEAKTVKVVKKNSKNG